MNNAKMWLVVKPTVGIPLFLSAVAIGSFAVHLAVLSKTNWYEDYLLGQELGSSAQSAALTEGAPALASADVTATPTAFSAEAGGQVVLVLMPDGTTAKAILQTPVLLTDVQYR